MNLSLKQLQEELKYDRTASCVQCGYCLPVCPTYTTFKNEAHSPRGRINLIKMAGEGRLTDLSALEEPFDLCLGCRACETACPTGVEYGEILEAARAALGKRRTLSVPARTLKKAMLRKMFPSRRMMNIAGHSTWIYQKSGLQKAGRITRVIDKLPYHLGAFEKVLPKPVSPLERFKAPKRVKAEGKRKYKVAFFTGCVMDAMFHRVNQLSIQLLARAGCEVTVVSNQSCCGALHAHSGEQKEARRLARQNIQAFEGTEADFIVNNAGGCGAMLYEYDRLLADEEAWAERARAFSGKVKDISQVLMACGLPDMRPRKGEAVTYQPSCHMTNVQKVTKEPVELLQSIPGIEWKEMNQADMCCGSAGIYNLVHYDASMEILDHKMKEAKRTNASVIITTNPGCLLQMKLGVEKEGLASSVRVLHLVEYLAEAAEIAEPVQ